MKPLKESLSLSGAGSIAVRLLFTWFAFLFTTMLSLAGGTNPEGDPLTYTLLDWLLVSPGAVLLYVYLIISFLFFHFGFQLVEKISWKWRILAGTGVVLVFCGLVWAASLPVLRYDETEKYEHDSRVEENPMGERLQKQVAAIAAQTANASRPVANLLSSRKEQDGLFDPRYYFTVFTNLSLETGCELDYTYSREGYLGFPELYIRHEGDASESGKKKDPWYLNVRLNGTPESYLEYAVLYLIADQFYINEYAEEFAVGKIIATKAEFDQLLNRAPRLSPWALKKACRLDFAPLVDISEDAAVVTFSALSGSGELELKTLVVGKEFPHQIIKLDPQPLIRHNFVR